MIVALIGQKGGSGKTTTAVCLAAHAADSGRRTLLVDADPQSSARTWGEIAAQDQAPAPTVIAMGAEMHRPGQLARLAENYDDVFIDCPPRHDEVQRAALMVADLVVLPCGPTAVDVWALSASIELVERARQLRPDLNAAVLITRKVSRSVLGRSARQALGDCGLDVLHTELGFRMAYQEAVAAGRGVTRYTPRSAAAREIKALTAELYRRTQQQEKTDAAA
ncbi:MAG: AAA family ATPase [Deltaproteobacteria bacterium]|nr:AAA family ATPase [Deltaproteobacteria bacterium]